MFKLDTGLVIAEWRAIPHSETFSFSNCKQTSGFREETFQQNPRIYTEMEFQRYVPKISNDGEELIASPNQSINEKEKKKITELVTLVRRLSQFTN